MLEPRVESRMSTPMRALAVLAVAALTMATAWAPASAAALPPAPAQDAARAAPTVGSQAISAVPIPTPKPTALPVPTPTGREYSIQVGDVLALSVLGEPTYSGSFPVRADGTILFSDDMVGAVAVSGSTPKQAAEAVTKRIGEFVKSPTVLLSISRFKAMVTGEVRQPGQYDMDSGARLLDAVGRAGGAKNETKDLAQVYLTRASGEEVKFSLKAFKEDADESQNPVLSPGDRISVGQPRSERQAEYKVSGAVKRPGSYPLDRKKQTRVSDAVQAADRWPEDGNPRAAQLVRKDGSKLTVDLTQLEQDAASEKNVVLQEGDEIFVPRNTAEVNVLGGVRKPGPYHVPAGTSVLEAIAMAGGTEDAAILKDCAVVRMQPRPERIGANLEKVMKGGDMSQNPILSDRDIVFVPVRAVDKNAAAKKSALDVITSVGENVLRYMWMFRYW